jgi:imidazolonepropionase-like amidohydrolase
VHSRPNFRDDEAKAIVDEAHRLGHKVVAHAGGREAIEQGVKAGVDSIEHGNGVDETLIDLMIRQGTYWRCTYGRGGRNANSELSQFRAANFRRAVEKGVEIALRGRYRRVCVDGDGAFCAHGEVGHDAGAGDSIGDAGRS